MTTFNDQWLKLSESKEYRHEFAKAQFKRLVPFQIRTLRKNRVMSQEELAEKSNLTQGVISRAEDPDYGNLNVNTILRVADGFDCVFIGRFVPYSEVDDWFVNLSEDDIRVPTFEEEDRLFRLGRLRRRRRVSRPKIRSIARPQAPIAIDTRRPLELSALNCHAAQLFLQWDKTTGSDASTRTTNPSPLPDQSEGTSIIERMMKTAAGVGGSYGR